MIRRDVLDRSFRKREERKHNFEAVVRRNRCRARLLQLASTIRGHIRLLRLPASLQNLTSSIKFLVSALLFSQRSRRVAKGLRALVCMGCGLVRRHPRDDSGRRDMRPAEHDVQRRRTCVAVYDAADHASESGGCLVQVVRQTLKRIQLASSGGLGCGSNTIVFKSVEEDPSGRPLEDSGRGLTVSNGPIRMLFLTTVSITNMLLVDMYLIRTSNLCIDISRVDSVCLREGQAFFFDSAQHKWDQLCHGVADSVAAPDIDGICNVSTFAVSEHALTLNAKDASSLQILQTNVHTPIQLRGCSNTWSATVPCTSFKFHQDHVVVLGLCGLLLKKLLSGLSDCRLTSFSRSNAVCRSLIQKEKGSYNQPSAT